MSLYFIVGMLLGLMFCEIANNAMGRAYRRGKP